MYFIPKTLSNWQLYNCCKDNQEPDWRNFSELELRPVLQNRHDCCVLPPDEAHRASFWTVYARNKESLADAITDIPNQGDIHSTAAHLSIRSGLPLC